MPPNTLRFAVVPVTGLGFDAAGVTTNGPVCCWPETVTLVRTAREHGAVAASAFGAGFGGAVWAMVSATTASTFVDEWRGSYTAAFPKHVANARWIVTKPSGPLRETSD